METLFKTKEGKSWPALVGMKQGISVDKIPGKGRETVVV